MIFFSGLDCAKSCKNEVLGYMTCCHQLSDIAFLPEQMCAHQLRDELFRVRVVQETVPLVGMMGFSQGEGGEDDGDGTVSLEY